MKKLLPIFVVLSMLVSVPIANAQGGFILGLVTGGLLFGDGTQTGAGNSANVMYTMARASERVKEPLQIRQVAIGVELYVADSYRPGGDVVLTLEEEFGRAISIYNGQAKDYKKPPLKSAETYEILQAARLFNERGQIGGILFTFIEKNKVIPLDQLPKLKQ